MSVLPGKVGLRQHFASIKEEVRNASEESALSGTCLQAFHETAYTCSTFLAVDQAVAAGRAPAGQPLLRSLYDAAQEQKRIIKNSLHTTNPSTQGFTYILAPPCFRLSSFHRLTLLMKLCCLF